MYDLLIKNGTVVTHETVFAADVAVQGGKIAAVGGPGTLGEAARVVDATGKYVLPGLIDPHVHIHHPFKGGYSMDDFTTATTSAACGGNTTVIDFAIQWDQEISLALTMENRKAQFAAGSVVDYALHSCPTKSSMETVSAFPELVAAGSPSFKLYMTYSKQGRMSDDGILYKMLEQTAQHGGIVGVHAENDAMCCFNEELFAQEGRTAPSDFPIAKGNLVEAEAINRVLYLNKFAGGNLYIFHLSTTEGLELLRQAKSLGQQVTAETCAHYLALTDEYYSRADGANFICSPPLRSAADQDALWDGLRSGDIAVVGSDHCGFGLEQKAFGQGVFQKTPNGLPGMELRLPVLYTKGVLEKRITLPKMVEVLSTNAAKTFGMYPRKGTLQPGADADIVLMDGAKTVEISPDVLHSPVDWSPYAGMALSGFAATVLLRGEVIVDEGSFCGHSGQGQFIPREIPKGVGA